MWQAFNRCFWQIAFMSTCCFGASAAQAVEVAGRHVYVVHSGVDVLWGSYLFLVSNHGSEAAEASFPIALPRETVDWQVQEGAEAKDVRLADEKGGLILSKSFPPGDSFISIGFKVPARQGVANLTVKALGPMPNLTVFTRQGGLTLAGDGFANKNNVPFSGEVYDTISRDGVDSGTELRMSVSGIAEGRGRFWLIGGIMAAVLAIAGFALAYRSRPGQKELGNVLA